MIIDNIGNIGIDGENATNAATDAENIDTDSRNADNIVNTERENDKSEDVVISEDNIDNATMRDDSTHDTVLGADNAENVALGETSTDDVPSILLYGRKTTDPNKVKTSKKCRPIWVKPLESTMDDPPADEIDTETVKGHAFDSNDV